MYLVTILYLVEPVPYLELFWGGTIKKTDELKLKEPLRDGVDANPLYGHLRNSDIEELRDVNGYYAGPLDP